MIRRMTALAGLVLAISAASAKAEFSYSTLADQAAYTFGSGSTLQIQNQSASNLTTPTVLSLLNFRDLTTATVSNTDTGSVQVDFRLTLNANGDTQSLDLVAIIDFARNDVSGTLSSLRSLTGLSNNFVVDGLVFDFGNVTYTPPTVNPNPSFYNGALSVVIFARAVPEPASMAMLGLGLAGVGVFRRKKKATSAVIA